MYKTIITSNSEYFLQSSIWMDIIRSILWYIVKFLGVLSDAAESVFNETYKLINFTDAQIFKNLVTKFSVFIVPILTVSFIAIGLMLTFSEKKPPVLKNIVIGLAIIYVMPQIITYFNEGLIAAKNDLLSNSMTNQIVLSNVSDLSYIANQGFKFDSTLADTCSNPEAAIDAIDVTTHLNPKKFSGDAKEVFSHYMTINELGKVDWKEFDKKGMFDIFDPSFYYRYSIHYFQLFLYLLANIIIFIFSAYAVVRMIYEIITARIMACIHSMDLASGQKTIKILEYFFQAYIILLFIPTLLKVYLLIMSYTNTNVSNGIVRAIIIFMSALVVVDGPSIIQKIYGYDLGMSQGASKVMSFMRLVQQQRMQHHMMQSAKSRREANALNKRGSFGSSGSGSNSSNSEPNVDKSSSSTNYTKEPDINNQSDTNNSSTNEKRKGGGAMSEPNIKDSSTENNNIKEPNINSDNASINKEGVAKSESGIAGTKAVQEPSGKAAADVNNEGINKEGTAKPESGIAGTKAVQEPSGRAATDVNNAGINKEGTAKPESGRTGTKAVQEPRGRAATGVNNTGINKEGAAKPESGIAGTKAVQEPRGRAATGVNNAGINKEGAAKPESGVAKTKAVQEPRGKAATGVNNAGIKEGAAKPESGRTGTKAVREPRGKAATDVSSADINREATAKQSIVSKTAQSKASKSVGTNQQSDNSINKTANKKKTGELAGKSQGKKRTNNPINNILETEQNNVFKTGEMNNE